MTQATLHGALKPVRVTTTRPSTHWPMAGSPARDSCPGVVLLPVWTSPLGEGTADPRGGNHLAGGGAQTEGHWLQLPDGGWVAVPSSPRPTCTAAGKSLTPQQPCPALGAEL